MILRILKVSQAYEPFLDKGGPAVKVPALARRLAQRGHIVTVLTADLGRSYAVDCELLICQTMITQRSFAVNWRR